MLFDELLHHLLDTKAITQANTDMLSGGASRTNWSEIWIYFGHEETFIDFIVDASNF